MEKDEWIDGFDVLHCGIKEKVSGTVVLNAVYSKYKSGMKTVNSIISLQGAILHLSWSKVQWCGALHSLSAGWIYLDVIVGPLEHFFLSEDCQVITNSYISPYHAAYMHVCVRERKRV